MKHFVEARQDTLAALSRGDIASLVEKICLIVDLQGKFRVLVKPTPEAEPDVVQQKVSDTIQPAADIFWDHEIWVEQTDASLAQKAVFESAWQQARPEPPGQDKVFVLDRRLSKDAWLGTPFEPAWPLSEHTPPVISFYSFKGGVGRTTALAAVAINLARAGKRVVVMDFDLEAPGAGSLFAPASGPPGALGVVDYLLEHPIAPKGSLDISEFYHWCDDLGVVKGGEPIYAVPAGTLDEWYLEKLARINYEFLYRTAAETGSPRSSLYDLLKSLRARLNPEAFLVDSRSGLHELGGLSVSGLAHLQVLFGLHSEQSWDGLSLVVSHLGKERVLSGQAQRDCMVVQAMAPPQDPVRSEAIRRFKERSFEVFRDCYYDSPDNPDAEWPVPDPEAAESPHFPAAVTWDLRVAGYSSLDTVAEFLCEGEHRVLARTILEKVGREL